MSTVGQGWKHSKGRGIDLNGDSICRETGTGMQSGMQHTKDGIPI